MWHLVEKVAVERFLPVKELVSYAQRNADWFGITDPSAPMVSTSLVDSLVDSFKCARAIYNVGDSKNWKGQPLHPMDEHCYFQTGDDERDRMIALYDKFVNGDATRMSELNELLGWVFQEKLNAYEFDRNEE